MKKILLTLALSLTLTLAGSVSAQAVAACQTMEQAQAAYNKSKATGIVVRDTYTQQLQTHYWQLGTYYQQLDKDNQQKAKDIQQINKDIQQIAKDKQLIEWEAALGVCDELDRFLEVLIPFMDSHSSQHVKQELIRIHTNRSGHMDGTNPGGQTHNINGFDNPSRR